MSARVVIEVAGKRARRSGDGDIVTGVGIELSTLKRPGLDLCMRLRAHHQCQQCCNPLHRSSTQGLNPNVCAKLSHRRRRVYCISLPVTFISTNVGLEQQELSGSGARKSQPGDPVRMMLLAGITPGESMYVFVATSLPARPATTSGRLCENAGSDDL